MYTIQYAHIFMFENFNLGFAIIKVYVYDKFRRV